MTDGVNGDNNYASFSLICIFTYYCSEMDIKLFLSVPSFMQTAGETLHFSYYQEENTSELG